MIKDISLCIAPWSAGTLQGMAANEEDYKEHHVGA
jgi:hypothetical protein